MFLVVRAMPLPAWTPLRSQVAHPPLPPAPLPVTLPASRKSLRASLLTLPVSAVLVSHTSLTRLEPVPSALESQPQAPTAPSSPRLPPVPSARLSQLTLTLPRRLLVLHRTLVLWARLLLLVSEWELLVLSSLLSSKRQLLERTSHGVLQTDPPGHDVYVKRLRISKLVLKPFTLGIDMCS